MSSDFIRTFVSKKLNPSQIQTVYTVKKTELQKNDTHNGIYLMKITTLSPLKFPDDVHRGIFFSSG